MHFLARYLLCIYAIPEKNIKRNELFHHIHSFCNLWWCKNTCFSDSVKLIPEHTLIWLIWYLGDFFTMVGILFILRKSLESCVASAKVNVLNIRLLLYRLLLLWYKTVLFFDEKYIGSKLKNYINLLLNIFKHMLYRMLEA